MPCGLGTFRLTFFHRSEKTNGNLVFAIKTHQKLLQSSYLKETFFFQKLDSFSNLILFLI